MNHMVVHSENVNIQQIHVISCLEKFQPILKVLGDSGDQPLQDSDPIIVNLNKLSRVLFEMWGHDELSKKGIWCM